MTASRSWTTLHGGPASSASPVPRCRSSPPPGKSRAHSLRACWPGILGSIGGTADGDPMTHVMMGLLVLITTTTMVVGFVTSDRSSGTALQFIALYVVGVVWPGIWSFQLHRALRPSDRRTRTLSWSPVVVGATTLLIALSL